MADKQKGLLEEKKKRTKQNSSEALLWVIECNAVID